MTLKEWISKCERGEASALAKRANTTRQTISNLARGGVPSVALAMRIAVATGGAVSMSDWPDDRAHKRRSPR